MHFVYRLTLKVLKRINKTILHSCAIVSTVHSHCWAQEYQRITFSSLLIQSHNAQATQKGFLVLRSNVFSLIMHHKLLKGMACPVSFALDWCYGFFCIAFDFPEVSNCFLYSHCHKYNMTSPILKITQLLYISLCWLYLTLKAPTFLNYVPYWHMSCSVYFWFTKHWELFETPNLLSSSTQNEARL